MSEQYINIGTNDIFSVSSETAERVISSRSGDAAILLLYIMKNRGRVDPSAFMREFDFSEQRFRDAMNVIRTPAVSASAAKPIPENLTELPAYTAKELAEAAGDPKFCFVRNMIEESIGRPLHKFENNSLYTLYDYLSIPAEVLAILVNHLIHEASVNSTPAHPVVVTFAEIRKTAIDWHKRGILSADVADSYVREQEQLGSGIRRCVSMMGLGGRKLTAAEKRTLTRFIEIDPTFELIELAYEATVFNTGAMKWNYMSKILESWHEKGFKTPADVNGASVRRTALAGSVGNNPSETASNSEYEEQVLNFLKSRVNGEDQ